MIYVNCSVYSQSSYASNDTWKTAFGSSKATAVGDYSTWFKRLIFHYIITRKEHRSYLSILLLRSVPEAFSLPFFTTVVLMTSALAYFDKSLWNICTRKIVFSWHIFRVTQTNTHPVLSHEGGMLFSLNTPDERKVIRGSFVVKFLLWCLVYGFSNHGNTRISSHYYLRNCLLLFK